MWPKRKASSEIPSHEVVIIQDSNDLGPGGEERTKQNLEHRTSKTTSATLPRQASGLLVCILCQSSLASCQGTSDSIGQAGKSWGYGSFDKLKGDTHTIRVQGYVR